MAATLSSAAVLSTIRFTYSNPSDIASPSTSLQSSTTYVTLSGNSAWWDTRTLGGTASEDIDLAGGVADVYGRTLTFTTITSLSVFNTGTTGGPIRIGGATASGWVGPFGTTADFVSVGRGFSYQQASSGWAVTAGSADILRIATTGVGTNYNIIITGIAS